MGRDEEFAEIVLAHGEKMIQALRAVLRECAVREAILKAEAVPLPVYGENAHVACVLIVGTDVEAVRGLAMELGENGGTRPEVIDLPSRDPGADLN